VPEKIVPPPRCGNPSVYAPSNPWRPFCSERCRTVDFVNWATEAYRVPAPAESPEDAPPPAEPDAP